MVRAVLRLITYAGVAATILGLIGIEIFAGSASEARSGQFWQLAMLGVVGTGLSSVALLVMRDRRGLLGLSPIALLMIWLVTSFTAGGHGIIARTTAADGTEMCVIETPGGETRQTGFYYRRP